MGTDGSSTMSPRREGVYLLLASAVVFVGTWFEYEDLVAFESGALGSVRLNVLLRILYDAFGFWGVIGTMVAVGVLLAALGLKQLISPWK